MSASCRVQNLTPHEVVIVGGDGAVIARFPSEGVARVAASFAAVGNIPTAGGPVPLVQGKFGAIEGLPTPVVGLFLVVSRVVAAAARGTGRQDLVVPADLVRAADGRVIGARSLEWAK